MIWPFPPIRLPSMLRQGCRVGIVATSSPFEKGEFIAGVHLIQQMGFEAVYDEAVFSKRDYLAGSDLQRADLFNAFAHDPSIAAIFCARGGYGALRILPMIDYSALAAHPKVIVGCSDVTSILNSVYRKTGLITFHGPMVTNLSKASALTIRSFYETLTSAAPLSFSPKNPVVITSGKASGPLAGGNLATLCHLVGTNYQPYFNGHIILLEDIGEAPYRIDRMLTQMKLARCFEGVLGVMVGTFKDCGSDEKVYRVIEEIFAHNRIPVLGGFDFGHKDPNFTIPIGVEAILDTQERTLSTTVPHLASN